MDPFMTLTTEQRHAVDVGVPVTIEIDGQTCVLIRKDIYEKSRKIIDLSSCSPEESYAGIEQAWGDDPGLDAYQDLKR